MTSMILTSLVVLVAAALLMAMQLREARRRADLIVHIERALRERDAALQDSARLSQALAGRLILAREAERQRIGRELHDDLSQKLALLSVEIDRLTPSGMVDRRRLEPRLRRLSTFVDEIAKDVHDLSHALHPAKVETIGLVAAMESLCRDISHRYYIVVDFSHKGDAPQIDAQVSLHLYRIAQEALQNVVKHSGAKQARVELEIGDTQLELRVADAGRGFVPDA